MVTFIFSGVSPLDCDPVEGPVEIVDVVYKDVFEIRDVEGELIGVYSHLKQLTSDMDSGKLDPDCVHTINGFTYEEHYVISGANIKALIEGMIGEVALLSHTFNSLENEEFKHLLELKGLGGICFEGAIRGHKEMIGTLTRWTLDRIDEQIEDMIFTQARILKDEDK